MEINSSSRVSLQDHSIESILIFIGLKKRLARSNRKCKNVDEIKFHVNDPILKYRQNLSNSCCFNSLASAFKNINKAKAYNDTSRNI